MLLRSGIAMAVLILGIGIAVKVTVDRRSENITPKTTQAASNFQKYNASYPIGCSNVFYKSPPEGTNLAYQSQSNFELDLLGCSSPVVSMRLYVYKYPVSLSDNSTRQTLFTSTPSVRSDGKYCFFGYSGSTCSVWKDFFNQPSILMKLPLPNGNQAPGYTVRSEFCFANGQCWYYETAFWIDHSKDLKYCTVSSDCACKNYGSSCQIVNKNFGSVCTLKPGQPGSQAFCNRQTPTCIKNQCQPAPTGSQ